jgi:hypothetical protein
MGFVVWSGEEIGVSIEKVQSRAAPFGGFDGATS